VDVCTSQLVSQLWCDIFVRVHDTSREPVAKCVVAVTGTDLIELATVKHSRKVIVECLGVEPLDTCVLCELMNVVHVLAQILSSGDSLFRDVVTDLATHGTTNFRVELLTGTGSKVASERTDAVVLCPLSKLRERLSEYASLECLPEKTCSSLSGTGANSLVLEESTFEHPRADLAYDLRRREEDFGLHSLEHLVQTLEAELDLVSIFKCLAHVIVRGACELLVGHHRFGCASTSTSRVATTSSLSRQSRGCRMRCRQIYWRASSLRHEI